MQEAICFRAGAGRSAIQYPMDVFPFREGKDLWTGIHDVQCARAVILDAGLKVAIMSVEVVGLEADLEEKIRKVIQETTGIPSECIWLSASHTVTTPHMRVHDRHFPGENPIAIKMHECILIACKQAILDAHTSMRRAKIGFGSGTCTANINRAIPTCDGWWLGSGEEFEANHAVPVIKIADEDGEPIAVMYNYNCELAVMDNSVMSDGGRHMTADLAGVASRFVEEQFEDKMVALYLPGVTSDQGPAYRAVRTVRQRGGKYREIDIQEKGWLLMELEGERLGEQVLVATESICCDSMKAPIALKHEAFWFPGQQFHGLPKPTDGPVKEWPFIPEGEKTRSVEAMLLNDLIILAISGLGIRTAKAIQARSPFAHTIVTCGISGGAGHLPTDGAKNMAEADMYEKVSFQARNSTFGKGAAEKMQEDAVGFLNKFYEDASK